MGYDIGWLTISCYNRGVMMEKTIAAANKV